MKLKDKYYFRPYSPTFPLLFENEKDRLKKVLGKSVQIDHIGSTAVPDLGGKGVIDISIVTPKTNWNVVSKKLSDLGYVYKKKEKEKEVERLFFTANIPDDKLGTRLYHIHLSYPESLEFKKEIGFRDYLRNHPEKASEYSMIKKKAAERARRFSSKNKMRDTYNQTKEEFIQQIMRNID